jgi:hypothetical protein
MRREALHLYLVWGSAVMGIFGHKAAGKDSAGSNRMLVRMLPSAGLEEEQDALG